MNVISQDAMAKIAVNKSLLKEYVSSEYPRVVYLNNGNEFQIQLFNPEKFIIAAKIFIDGEELNDMLVLRPGERVWLERYLDKARKFKFSTYEIDDSAEAKEAASNNGDVTVNFYRVKTKRSNPIVFVNNVHDYVHPTSTNYRYPPTYNTTTTAINSVYYSSPEYSLLGEKGINGPSGDPGVSYNSAITADSLNLELSCACSAEPTRCSASIETGRVEEGSYSNQKFSYVNYDFEDYPWKIETIKILPLSRKPYTQEDLQKRYCSNCGRKLSPKHKFCPYCGTKVE